MLIVGLVEALHQRVPVSVDRQHRERQQLIGRPVFPYPSNGHRAAVRALDTPAHRLAGFVGGRMMHNCLRFQALRKDGLLVTVSVRAL